MSLNNIILKNAHKVFNKQCKHCKNYKPKNRNSCQYEKSIIRRLVHTMTPDPYDEQQFQALIGTRCKYQKERYNG